MIYPKLLHLKIMLLGHKELEEEGVAKLPCKKCGKEFTSYKHYGDFGDVYDTLCEKCLKDVQAVEA